MAFSLRKFGFNVRREKTRDGSLLFSLETPFCWVTGEKYAVFIEQVDDKFHIFDDGLSLFEILVAGVDMSTRFKTYSLRKVVAEWDVNFSNTGIFESYSPMNEAEETVSNYLRAMHSVDDWIWRQINRRRRNT